MVTFSKEKRLVEAGADDGSIRAMHDIWIYWYLAGFFPRLHKGMTQVSQLLKIDWRMAWRKAVAMFDTMPKPKPKSPASVS
jgi:hypothetical protein